MESNKKVKVIISVLSKFHAFELAKGLNQLGALYKLYTSYPKSRVVPSGVPADKIKSISALGIFIYLNDLLGKIIPEYLLSGIFDRIVSLGLKKPTDGFIFHGWSGFSEKSLLKAKKIGMVSMVERSCPHIDDQLDLINDEMRLLLKKPPEHRKDKTWDSMKREYEIADYIIVPSEYSAKSFIQRGFNPSKIITVHLCSNREIHPPAEKNKRFTVLCVGGYFYRKGIYYLIKAWEELGLDDAELVIKGYIPEEFPELLNFKNTRIISTHLSDSELLKLYQEASVFVLPSIDDGFGMVVVEAMAAGSPVIVTENVGAADIIEEGKDGFIVPIRDVNALKDKIKFFYDNPDKVQEMGKMAIVKSKNYTPEAYVKRMMAVYEKALEIKGKKI